MPRGPSVPGSRSLFPPAEPVITKKIADKLKIAVSSDGLHSANPVF